MSNFGSGSVVKFFTEEPEGFQYLGSGVLICFAGTLLFAHKIIKKRVVVTLLPLLFVAVAMFLYAMSNQISIFGSDLVYWWPQLLHDLREVFRASSRFGWPLYYLLAVGGFLWASLNFSKQIKVVLAILILAISLLDGVGGINQMHKEISREVHYFSSIQDGRWLDLSSNHERVFIYPNFDSDSGLGFSGSLPWQERWFDLARFAVSHDLVTNFGATPRPISRFVVEENRRILGLIENGELDENTIYIIGSLDVWEESRLLFGPEYIHSVIEGLFVIASRK